MPNPTLGVMALYLEGRKLEELAYFRKLSLEAKKLDLNVIVFTPEDVDAAARTIRAWVYRESEGKWVRASTRFPEIIYDRCRFQRNFRFQLLRKFRADYPNLLYLNRPLQHKWGVHKILSKSKTIRPYLPETVDYKSSSSLLGMLDKHKLVYAKPIDGTGGRGIFRIEETDGNEYQVQGRERSRKIIAPFTVSRNKLAQSLSRWDLSQRYLIQQGIHIKLKDGRVQDFRLLIQKNGSGQWEVTGCAGRIGAKRSITSNLHGGGAAISRRKLLRMRFDSEEKIRAIEQDMERLAHLVAKQMEKQFGSLCELALDIAVEGTGKVYLLEINPKPAREVFSRIGEEATYRKAITRPLEYALHVYRSQNTASTAKHRSASSLSSRQGQGQGQDQEKD